MEISADLGLDDVFEALANNHRRAVMHALSLRPHSISQLASIQGLSLPAIHKHIRVLEEAGMVIRKKAGRTNFLALNRKPLRDLQEWVGGFNPYWGSEKETLENYARHLGGRNTDNEV
jgi:DNA-binding transcriptional ArsR family regulator